MLASPRAGLTQSWPHPVLASPKAGLTSCPSHVIDTSLELGLPRRDTNLASPETSIQVGSILAAALLEAP